MNKENTLSLIRNIFTIVGGYFLGKSLFGVHVTGETWEIALGVIMTIAGIIMSITDKSVTVEKMQGAIRHVVSAIGGILAGSGVIDMGRLESWTGIILVIVPIVMGWLSRKKVAQLEDGQIAVRQLKGSSESRAKPNPV